MQCPRHQCDIVEVYGPAGGCPSCKSERESAENKQANKELARLISKDKPLMKFRDIVKKLFNGDTMPNKPNPKPVVSNELKPCPFPHKKQEQDLLVFNQSDYSNDWIVQCNVCGVCGPNQANREDAKNAWNQRSTTEVRRFAEEVREEVEKITYDSVMPDEGPECGSAYGLKHCLVFVLKLIDTKLKELEE